MIASPGGGGVLAAPVAYGFVRNEASDVIEEIGSRSAGLPFRRFPSLLPFSCFGDLLGEVFESLTAFGVFSLEFVPGEPYDFPLSWLTGGWL